MPTKNEKKKKLWVFFVKHPEHTVAPVMAESWEQATVKAAEFWGVAWRTVAALCECERKWEAHRCICMDCGKYFHGEDILCDFCRARRRDEEQNYRQYLKNGGWRDLPKKIGYTPKRA